MQENTSSILISPEERSKYRIYINSDDEMGLDYPYQYYTISSAKKHTLSLEDKAIFLQSEKTSERVFLVKLKSYFSLIISAFVKYSNIPEMTLKGIILFAYNILTKQSEIITLTFPEIKLLNKNFNIGRMFFISIINTPPYGYLCLVILYCHIFILQIKETANKLTFEILFKEKKQGKILFLGYQMNEFDLVFNVLSKPNNIFISIKCVYGLLSEKIGVYLSEDTIKDFSFQFERFTLTSCKWIIFTEKHSKKAIIVNKEKLMPFSLHCETDLSINVFHLICNDHGLDLLTDSRNGDTISILQYKVIYDPKEYCFNCIIGEIYKIKCENYEKHVFNVINDQCFYINLQTNFFLYYLNKKTWRFESVHNFNFGSFTSLAQTFELNTFSINNKTHVILDVYKDMNIVVFDFELKDDKPWANNTRINKVIDDTLILSYNKGNERSIKNPFEFSNNPLLNARNENKDTTPEEAKNSFIHIDKTVKSMTSKSEIQRDINIPNNQSQPINEELSTFSEENRALMLSIGGKPFVPNSFLKKQQQHQKQQEQPMKKLIESPFSLNEIHQQQETNYINNMIKPIDKLLINQISNSNIIKNNKEIQKQESNEKKKDENQMKQNFKIIEGKVDIILESKIASISNQIAEKYDEVFTNLGKQAKELEDKQNKSDEIIGTLLNELSIKDDDKSDTQTKGKVNKCLTKESIGQHQLRNIISKTESFSTEAIYSIQDTNNKNIILNNQGSSYIANPINSTGLNKDQTFVDNKSKIAQLQSSIKAHKRENTVNTSKNQKSTFTSTQAPYMHPQIPLNSNNMSQIPQINQNPNPNQTQVNQVLLSCYHALNSYNLYNNLITSFMNSQIMQAMYFQPLQFGIQSQQAAHLLQPHFFGKNQTQSQFQLHPQLHPQPQQQPQHQQPLPPLFSQQQFPFNMIQQMQQFQQGLSAFNPSNPYHRYDSLQMQIQQLNNFTYLSNKNCDFAIEQVTLTLNENRNQQNTHSNLTNLTKISSSNIVDRDKSITNYTPTKSRNSSIEKEKDEISSNERKRLITPSIDNMEIETDNEGFIEIKSKKKGSAINNTHHKKGNNKQNYNQRKKK